MGDFLMHRKFLCIKKHYVLTMRSFARGINAVLLSYIGRGVCLSTLLFYKNHCWKLCKIYKVGAEKQKHIWNMYKNVVEVYNDK